MKKIIMLLAVAVLMFGFSGQAMAAFADGDLIQVIYQTGVNNGNEYITDLGSFGALTSLTTATQLFSNNNLFSLGALNTPNTYQVAYFSYDSAIGTSGAYWVSGSSVVPSNARSGGNKIFNGLTSVQAGFGTGTTAGAYTIATVSQGNSNSYMQGMDGGVAGSANFNGFTNNTSTGEATITGSYVDQYLYYFATPNTAGSAVEVADIRTYSDGHTVINPSVATTPIPPSVLLMGSSLIGLVGIRRKMVA